MGNIGKRMASWSVVSMGGRGGISQVSSSNGVSGRDNSTVIGRQSIVGTDERVLPDSQFRLLRRKCRQAASRGTVGSAIVNTRVLLCTGSYYKLNPEPDMKVLGLSEDAGLKLGDSIDSWWKYYISDPVSVSGTGDFHSDLSGIVRSVFDNGDCYIVIKNSQDRLRTTGIQTSWAIIPGWQVCNPNSAGNTEKIVNGVEYNAYGYAVRIWVMSGVSSLGTMTWTPVEIYNNNICQVLHLSCPDRVLSGHNRSLPLLAPVLDDVSLLNEFREAYVAKALNESRLNMALSNGLDAEDIAVFGSTSESGGLKTIEVDRGWGVELPPGADIHFFPNSAPAPGVKEFDMVMFASACGACGVSPEVCLRLYSTSYTAARAAELGTRRQTLNDRRSISTRAANFLYGHVLTELVASGKIKAAGYKDRFKRVAYQRATWDSDPLGAINPVAEANARVTAEEMEWVSRAENAAEYGNDDRDLRPIINRERKEKNGRKENIS